MQYIFRVGGEKNLERRIRADSRGEALEIAKTALSTFASSLRPPDKVELTVMTERRECLAVLRFSYEIETLDDVAWTTLMQSGEK